MRARRDVELMPINDGGPAFPFHHKYDSGDAREGDGLSLRDYFAAHAPMPHSAWIASETVGGATFSQVLSKHAYEYADAMLKAREVEPVKGVDPRD